MSAEIAPALLLALSTGLLGGFGHCIGMCGPIVASYSLSERSAGMPVLLPHVLYHAGRITTYGLIGGLMGLSGSFLNIAGRMTGLQNGVMVLSGVLMLMMGMNIAGLWGSPRLIEQHNRTVLLAARRISSSRSPARYAALGLVLGLLPCGLSYTMFVAAAGSGSLMQGMALAVIFGLGTLPALLAFGVLVTVLTSRARGVLYRSGGVVVICMGAYYVWRGIALYAHL